MSARLRGASAVVRRDISARTSMGPQRARRVTRRRASATAGRKEREAGGDTRACGGAREWDVNRVGHVGRVGGGFKVFLDFYRNNVRNNISKTDSYCA